MIPAWRPRSSTARRSSSPFPPRPRSRTSPTGSSRATGRSAAWQREQIGEQLFRGTSLFDGSETFVRISADESLLLVDYAVGPSLDQMPRVNSARIVPGPLLGHPADSCVVTLMKWRTAGQSDALWERGCVTFDTEIHMIKGRLELGF